jgi:TRAP-type C4-dicarboxylate transport system permease small subunit
MTVVFVWAGIEFTRFAWNRTSELADLPLWLIHVAWPVAGVTWIVFAAIANTPIRARIRTMASLRRDKSGQTSTSKCCDSLMPTMAPIMIVQTNRKRAISSVQM